MKRRSFLALTAAAAAFARAALAQQARPVPRAPGGRLWLIGALVGATQAQSDIDWLAPFRRGMTQLGYTEGRDYVIAARFTDGDAARLAPYAKELAALGPDILICANSTAATALQQFTKSIPILGANIGDLETLVGKSLAHPAGNITGITSDISSLVGKHCDLALEIMPAAKRIGILLYSLNTDTTLPRQLVSAAASSGRFVPVFVDVNRFDDLSPAYRALLDQKTDIAVVGASALLAADRARTAAAAAAAKLPAIYNAREYVEAGGLISYGYDRRAAFERLATFADRVFAGDRPGDLPVEQTSNYLMAINLKTAKALGLTIPPTVLFRADLVIE